MRKFLMGTAAVALAVTGAHADPGNGKGKGADKGNKNQAAAGPNAGGQARNNAGPPEKAKPKDNAAQRRPATAQGNAMRQANRGNNPGNQRNNGQRNSGNAARFDRDDRSDRSDRDIRYDRDDERDGRYASRRYRDDDRDDLFRWRDGGREYDYRVIEGCPPGLAKKNNGCMPPGLAKRRDYDYDRVGWWGYGDREGRYRYYDGNLVRLSNDGGILGYLPLLGGALSVGNAWPSYFEPQPLPNYYESYYSLSDGSYGYYDDTIYRLNPETAAITGIAALLTGDTISVGSPMPLGYDVYNVPFGYRDRYADGPEALYRYSDGYVYQLDPETRLVAAAIELLV